MRSTFIITLTCVLLAAVHDCYGATVQRNTDRDGHSPRGQVDDLKSKLLKLKILLEELQDEDDLSAPESRIPPPDMDTAAEVTSDVTNLDKPISDSGEDDDMVPVIAMKKLISQFSPRDIVELKALKDMLTQARGEMEDLDNKEKILPQNRYDPRSRGNQHGQVSANGNGVKSARPKVSWRERERQLQSARDAFYLQRKNTDHSAPLPKIEAHTEEGSFGAFRDEIKTAVEKNLLQDISLAIHSGIPVQEIMKDFSEHDLPDMDDDRD